MTDKQFAIVVFSSVLAAHHFDYFPRSRFLGVAYLALIVCVSMGWLV